MNLPLLDLLATPQVKKLVLVYSRLLTTCATSSMPLVLRRNSRFHGDSLSSFSSCAASSALSKRYGGRVEEDDITAALDADSLLTAATEQLRFGPGGGGGPMRIGVHTVETAADVRNANESTGLGT